MFHKLYKTVLTDVCCLCDTHGVSGLDLCHGCHKSLPFNHFSCPRCAAPLPESTPATSTQTESTASETAQLLAAKPQQVSDLLCGNCLSDVDAIDHAIVPFLYRPPIDFMIKRLKFSEEMKYSRLLGDLLADAVARSYSLNAQHTDALIIGRHAEFPDTIIPVPVHTQRLLQRGFNQAEQIANIVASRFGRKPDTSSVARSLLNPSQTNLSARQREINIRRAFDVQQFDKIRGLHVAIVDDVYTTGATARAIARRLKGAGAARVSVWAVARTP